MTRILSTLLLLLLAGTTDAAKPNVVVFLVDDLGVMDIGAYNPKTFYETPNIDRLAREGMRFTNGYAANPVCSPTRFSIMTGKYPTRAGCTNFFSGNREGRFKGAPLNNRIPLEEVTLGQALKDQGYKTAFVGKWHLGPTAVYWPENRGFDINIGGHDRGLPPGGYFAPFKNPRLQDRQEGEHLPMRLAEEAAAIIEKSKAEPFLLYLAFYSVHTPLQAPKELIAKYETKAKQLGLEGRPEFADEEQVWPVKAPRQVRTLQKHATYAAMMESMDTAVGKVLAKLKELNLDDNTIVCFTSDNGGLSTSEGSPTSNLPFRGGKGWVYEGGIREPFLVKWPGVVKPGSVCDVPVMSMDFYPTLVEAAGDKPRAGQVVDGVSLMPLLKGGTSLPREALYWHYPHYSNQGGFPGGAVRVGDLKLVERFEDGRVHLYNLKDDEGETKDLAADNPAKVRELRDRLHRWYGEVGAKFLEPKDGAPMPWRPEARQKGVK